MFTSSASPKREGFLPLHGNNSTSSMSRQLSKGEHVVNIPLTPIQSHVSTGARKEGQTMPDMPRVGTIGHDEDTAFHRHIGRRRATGTDGGMGAAPELTTMGKIYDKVLNFSIVTRYILYILPLSVLLLIPTLININLAPHAAFGGVKIMWVFIWIQIVWCSLWVSKLVARALPYIFQALVGVVSSGVKKYSLVLRALEVPLSLVGWSIASLCTFLPLMTRNPDLRGTDRWGKVQNWENRMNKVLVSCLVSSLIFLAQKVIIQIVSVDYHRRQFAHRIQANKDNVKFLAQLYEVSRNMFPEFGEFAEEDFIIHQGLAGALKIPKMRNSGTTTPMRHILGNLNYVQDKVTSTFGNIAQEVTGNKNVFNPTSPYATVLEALQRKKSAEALAKRMWMSLVPAGQSALTLDDLKEVMGGNLEIQAMECFQSLDRDQNGDVSLDEMILHVVHTRNERFAVAKSMQDVDNAISALDNVLAFISFILVVLVFVIAQQSSVGTTIAGAGTMLISLSFVFALTAQEVLGSCIFLFVKHPYDVGDRVDIDDRKYIVEHMSLLYTVLKRIDCHKITQIPNNILNTKPIENVSRSKYMQEQLTVPINFNTSFEDIQKLKHELLIFIKENSRDYQEDLEVEITGINELDRLILKVDIKHRGNWANETLSLQRRNRFLCALVAILRNIPIYGPGGGDLVVGEQGKPMYTVSVPDDVARENMRKAAETKAAERWDHDVDSDDESESGKKDKGANTGNSSSTAVGDIPDGRHDVFPFADRGHAETGSSAAQHRNDSVNRRGDLDEVRGMLKRESTKGRRKPAPSNPSIPAPQYPLSQQTGYQQPR